MPGNRKEAEQLIVTYIDKIAPGGENKDIYVKLFAAMNDIQFDEFINDLESGKKFLVVIAPNFGKNPLNTARNIAIGKELGYNFFQRLWMGAKGKTPAYLTPVEYLVIDLPFRRASQLLTKKISLPEHNRNVDMLTGQPTGESSGSRVSYPELQIAAAMNLDSSIVELMKYRGGDIKGGHALNAMISKYGAANLKTLSNYASGTESTKTLRTFLLCAHLKSTL